MGGLPEAGAGVVYVDVVVAVGGVVGFWGEGELVEEAADGDELAAGVGHLLRSDSCILSSVGRRR